MIVKPLNQIDITNLSDDNLKQIRESLYTDLIVVLKHQSTNPWYFTNLIERIGNIANYNQFYWTKDGNVNKNPVTKADQWKFNKEEYPVQRTTGMKKKNNYTGIFASGILDWHANLNGPDRADGVALQALDEGCLETSTSFLNTNLAYNDLVEDFKKELEDVHCEYEYDPDTWAKGLPDEQLKLMLKNKSKYKMWLVQENIKGTKGLFFYTNNKCKMITEDNTLYKRLYDHCFQEKYIYQHWWEPGDIVLMDQLLTLHKRDQNDPEVLAKRVLHRITFYISNDNKWILKRNSF